MKPLILHVDLNSFFASVEQQTNPALRGKPISILKAIGRTCVIASSNEAKKFGVKTGMSLSQVKTLCPQITLVAADFPQYEFFTRRFIKLMNQFSDVVEVFSLDEVFLDATWTAVFFGGPVNLAKKIQATVGEQLGECLGVSIGIAKNKFLAKLASSLALRKNFFIINDEDQAEVLRSAKFEDVCGIGRRLTQRLKVMGITNLGQIVKTSEKILAAEFGPFWACQLKRLARGEDNGSLITPDQLSDPKSVSRTFTLFKNTRDPVIIKALIRNLVEEACFKLRKMGLVGRQFGLAIRGDNFNQSEHITRQSFTDNSQRIFNEVYALYNHNRWPYSVRFAGVLIKPLAITRFTPPL
ncbi:MAG: polymerase IV protein [Candidatus Beckwithbacteria bacterium GW2011_GWA2_43_10]|uniref:Polymerase IV protein n=1 Tax=Candidatus Beckwithbacteria bacterium GW2011_GWA2_43_10 TaxID=1618369 RepID=A0A0G1BZV9_9BACT|nr:MAG: polymerase IV protein [Candidatus Beckwithbacteria bacterium GW2011_GWA2_43_10]